MHLGRMSLKQQQTKNMEVYCGISKQTLTQNRLNDLKNYCGKTENGARP